MLHVNLLQRVARLARRLAEAGREARAASRSVGGRAAEQITEVIAAAAGKVVRAAVVGAVTAVVRSGARRPRLAVAPPTDPWDDEPAPVEGEADPDAPDGADRPAWARATRAVGSALTVAAGAAAATPGGRLVAADLAACAAEPTE